MMVSGRTDVSFAREWVTPMIDTTGPDKTPRPYPSDLVEDVTSESGTRLHLRPIRAEDAQLLVSFHARLTPDSVYRRYFSLHPVLSAAEVAHLTQVDYVERFAFIVLDGETLIGVARYDCIPGTPEAEVAFVVEDKYQGQGIGMLLLEHLADVAYPLGITHFSAETQAGNRDMLNVFYYSGYEVTTKLEDEIISVHFAIAPTEKSREARRLRAEKIAGFSDRGTTA